ncbi:MAG: PilZ domain-containing protein [Pseudomonadota bacterium]
MEARKSPRVDTDADGQCKSARGFTWDVHVDDLSPGGCRVDDPRHGLQLGTHIHLMIADNGPHVAEVAWRRGDRVGLAFLSPLDPKVFALMASGEWDQARDAMQGAGKEATPIRYPIRRVM